MLRKIFYTCIHFIKIGFSFFRSDDAYVSDKTMLLVDGEVDFCQLNANALEKQGFKVIVAHTLESAKFQLYAYNPTIILLNHKLPDGPGIEFLEKNKLVLENKHVVFMTEDSSIELRATSVKLGAFDILPKPFEPSALNKIVYLAANFAGHE